MKDLEERIIRKLREGECSINNLHRSLKCNKENLVLVVKKLENEGRIRSRQDGTKKLISINPDFDQKILVDLFYYVRKIEDHIEKKIIILQELKQSGKTLEYLNEHKAYVLNSESKEHLDDIIELLKSLNNLSSSYSYLKDFNSESKHTEYTISTIQKRCVKTTKKTIKYLVKNHHKMLLKSYIYLNIFRTDELQKLENYFKSHK